MSASTTSTYQHMVGKPSFLSMESYGLSLLLFGFVLFSFQAMFVKLAVDQGVPAMQLVWFRSLVQGIGVLSAMLFFMEESPPSNASSHDATTTSSTRVIAQPFGAERVRNIVVVRGMVGGIGFMLHFYTIAALPLGDAVTLLSLSPIITVCASGIFLGERLYLSVFLAAVASVAGSVLIAEPSFLLGNSGRGRRLLRFLRGDDDDDSIASSTPQLPFGYATGLLGSCFAAAVVMLVRKAGTTGVHTLQLMFSWCFFGFIFSSLANEWGRPEGEPFLILPTTTLGWWYSFGMLFFGTGSHFLMNYAARFAPAGLTAITKSSSILWSYLLEMIVFHKIPKWITLLGTCLILTSLLVVAIVQKSKTDEAAGAKQRQRSEDSEAPHETSALLPAESEAASSKYTAAR